MRSPGGRHFDTKTWHYPTACRLQSWDASGQTTNREGIQAHPSADRLPKLFLSPQPPLNTSLTWPCPPEGQGPAPPTSGQAPVLLTRKPAQPSRLASPTYNPAACSPQSTILQPAEQRLQTQKVRQSEMTEKYVRHEGTR